jgi:hypothetical protein
LRLHDKGVRNLISDIISPNDSNTISATDITPPVLTVPNVDNFALGDDDLSSLTHHEFHVEEETDANVDDEINAANRTATNEEEDEADDDDSRKGGRKIGTTIKAKKGNIANIKLATKSVSSKYLVIQAEAKLAGKKVKKIQLTI